MPVAIRQVRTFLSYARSDRDIAISLRTQLEAAGLTIWHDVKDLGAGQWWSQIADAIEDTRLSISY